MMATRILSCGLTQHYADWPKIIIADFSCGKENHDTPDHLNPQLVKIFKEHIELFREMNEAIAKIEKRLDEILGK